VRAVFVVEQGTPFLCKRDQQDHRRTQVARTMAAGGTPTTEEYRDRVRYLANNRTLDNQSPCNKQAAKDWRMLLRASR